MAFQPTPFQQALAERYSAKIEQYRHNRESAAWHLIARRGWVLRHGSAYEHFTPYGCDHRPTLKTR